MSALTTFLSRTHGRGRLSWVDWITYAYLVFGFLLIFLPVSWIALNSVKSSFQLEKQDISLLPSDFERVGRATVYGPDGREKFVIADLPDWVLNWSDLSDEEQSARDVNAYLGTHQGRAFYALRSHLDQVPALTRALIAQRGLPDWLLRYPSMSANARAERDLDAVLRGLNVEEQRLLKEFLGIAPFEPNRFVTQILVSALIPKRAKWWSGRRPSSIQAARFSPRAAWTIQRTKSRRCPPKGRLRRVLSSLRGAITSNPFQGRHLA